LSDTFKVEVISPEKLIFSGEIESASIPGSDGYFGVLKNHSAMVSELGIGIMELKSSSKTVKLVIDAGFAEIKSNTVKILTNGGDLRENLNLDKAKKELEEALKSTSKQRDELIKKAKARIEIHNQ
jgi:F-type H+-transporting ATPase subunit epsilon